MCASVEGSFITNKNLYSLIVRPTKGLGEEGIWFLLGILNSRLVSSMYLEQVQQATKDDFPQVTIADVLSLPCPGPSPCVLRQVSLFARKMSALVPKLRTAKTDTERQTLQNAVTATDRQIDALVYELYGLTPDEIALVESGGGSAAVDEEPRETGKRTVRRRRPSDSASARLNLDGD
jgi:hypothetical protein